MLISVILLTLTTIHSSARSSKPTNSVYVPRKKRAREPTTEDILESTKRNPTGLYTNRVDIVITEYDLSTRSWEKIAPVFGTMAEGMLALGSGGFRDVYPASVSCEAFGWTDRSMVSKHYHAEGRSKVVNNFSELTLEAALEEETRVGVQLNETVMELARQFSDVIAQPLRYTKVYLVREKLSGKTYVIEEFVEGKPWKVLLNSGMLDDFSPQPEDSKLADLATAFAHFTLATTNEAMIVLDVQGVGSMFLDPAVCTNKTLDPNEERGDSANLFGDAIVNFKQFHRCNDMCLAASLDCFELDDF